MKIAEFEKNSRSQAGKITIWSGKRRQNIEKQGALGRQSGVKLNFGFRGCLN
jgi:hypothetical protein